MPASRNRLTTTFCMDVCFIRSEAVKPNAANSVTFISTISARQTSRTAKGAVFRRRSKLSPTATAASMAPEMTVSRIPLPQQMAAARLPERTFLIKRFGSARAGEGSEQSGHGHHGHEPAIGIRAQRPGDEKK